MSPLRVSRRALLGGAAAGTAGVGVGACRVGRRTPTTATRPLRHLSPVRGWFGDHPARRSPTAPAAYTLLASFTLRRRRPRRRSSRCSGTSATEAQQLCDGAQRGRLHPGGATADHRDPRRRLRPGAPAGRGERRRFLVRRPLRPGRPEAVASSSRCRSSSTTGSTRTGRHGDVLVQIAADRPDALAHALRQLMRATRDVALSCTGSIDGFSRAEPARAARPHRPTATLLGFKDGTANLDMAGADATDFVWVGADLNNGVEPAWTERRQLPGGAADPHPGRALGPRPAASSRRQIIGRSKATGAPLGSTGEADDPDYADDPQGDRIPLDAHIRLARPRTPSTEHQRMLRKGLQLRARLRRLRAMSTRGWRSSAIRRRSTRSSPSRSGSRASRSRSTRCPSAAASSSPSPASATRRLARPDPLLVALRPSAVKRLASGERLRSRRGSTRQKSCCLPSTNVTGICSPYSLHQAGVGA